MCWQAFLTSFLFLIFVTVQYGVSQQPPVADEVASKFEEFIHRHKVVFHDPKEYDQRLNIFMRNLDEIKTLNEKKAGGSDAVFGITEYSHLTFDEFKQQMLMSDSFNVTADAGVDIVGNDTMLDSIIYEQREGTPKNFDWRDYGIVTPIRSQGSCGSCWAFSTAAALESAYLYRDLKTKGSATPNIVLSTQQLVSCETHSSECSGGYVSQAMNYISENGLHYESDYPYTATSESCSTVDGPIVRPDGVRDLNSYTEEQLKTYLYNYGPISNGFAVGNEFQFYVSGIFHPPSCPTIVNHAMLLVGYGVADGTPYWLIKNQYGTGWGENGYIRVVRNSNKCSLKTQNYAPYYNI